MRPKVVCLAVPEVVICALAQRYIVYDEVHDINACKSLANEQKI